MVRFTMSFRLWGYTADFCTLTQPTFFAIPCHARETTRIVTLDPPLFGEFGNVQSIEVVPANERPFVFFAVLHQPGKSRCNASTCTATLLVRHDRAGRVPRGIVLPLESDATHAVHPLNIISSGLLSCARRCQTSRRCSPGRSLLRCRFEHPVRSEPVRSCGTFARTCSANAPCFEETVTRAHIGNHS
jgi:hypothetical protein